MTSSTHTVKLQVVQGQKIGLRINNANVICAVHPDTAAGNAGLVVDDLVVAVDGVDCSSSVTAVSLWAKGAGLQERMLKVLRKAAPDSPKTTPASPKAERVSSPPECANPESTSPTCTTTTCTCSTVTKPAARVLSDAEQVALTAADAFKADGNQALAGNFTSLAKGLYTKAIGVLEPLVASRMHLGGNSEDDPIRVALASCYSNRSSVNLAIEDAEAALHDGEEARKFRPEWVKGHSRCGDALTSLGRSSEAAEAYYSALQLQPTSEQLRERLEAARAAAVRDEAQERMRERAMLSAAASQVESGNVVDRDNEDPLYAAFRASSSPEPEAAIEVPEEAKAALKAAEDAKAAAPAAATAAQAAQAEAAARVAEAEANMERAQMEAAAAAARAEAEAEAALAAAKSKARVEAKAKAEAAAKAKLEEGANTTAGVEAKASAEGQGVAQDGTISDRGIAGITTDAVSAVESLLKQERTMREAEFEQSATMQAIVQEARAVALQAAREAAEEAAREVSKKTAQQQAELMALFAQQQREMLQAFGNATHKLESRLAQLEAVREATPPPSSDGSAAVTDKDPPVDVVDASKELEKEVVADEDASIGVVEAVEEAEQAGEPGAADIAMNDAGSKEGEPEGGVAASVEQRAFARIREETMAHLINEGM